MTVFKFQPGDRVVRLDGQSESIGTIVSLHPDQSTTGSPAYIVDGKGWGHDESVWTENFITLMPFDIGDKVVYANDEFVPMGTITFIENNGNMAVSGSRRYWTGTFSPDFLKFARTAESHVSTEVLDLYLSS